MWSYIRCLGLLIFLLGGLCGFGATQRVVEDLLGGFFAFISFFVFPVPFYLAPFYAGLAHGDWSILLINYGSTIVGGALFAVGQWGVKR